MIREFSRRDWFAADWLIREHLPVWLEPRHEVIPVEPGALAAQLPTSGLPPLACAFLLLNTKLFELRPRPWP